MNNKLLALHPRGAYLKLLLKSKYRGFTLIELMVGIAILAILSVVGITIYTGTLNSARDAKIKADFDSIYKSIEQARTLKQLPLKDLTGKDCSECYCRGVDTRTDPICLQEMALSWAGVSTGEVPRDPWGNIYILDENEEDPWWITTYGTGCVKDWVRSAGPDHYLDGYPGGSNDDRFFYVPTFRCEQP